MKAPVSKATSVAFSFASFVLSIALLSSALGAEQKTPVPESWGVVITKVVDTDRIEGKAGTRKFNFALANIVPFSAWPTELTQEEEKLRDHGMEFFKAYLLGKKGEERITFTGLEKGSMFRGDIILGAASHAWNPGAP
jgi:hypothetical protein